MWRTGERTLAVIIDHINFCLHVTKLAVVTLCFIIIHSDSTVKVVGSKCIHEVDNNIWIRWLICKCISRRKGKIWISIWHTLIIELFSCFQIASIRVYSCIVVSSCIVDIVIIPSFEEEEGNICVWGWIYMVLIF